MLRVSGGFWLANRLPNLFLATHLEWRWRTDAVPRRKLPKKSDPLALRKFANICPPLRGDIFGEHGGQLVENR